MGNWSDPKAVYNFLVPLQHAKDQVNRHSLYILKVFIQSARAFDSILI